VGKVSGWQPTLVVRCQSIHVPIKQLKKIVGNRNEEKGRMLYICIICLLLIFWKLLILSLIKGDVYYKNKSHNSENKIKFVIVATLFLNYVQEMPLSKTKLCLIINRNIFSCKLPPISPDDVLIIFRQNWIVIRLTLTHIISSNSFNVSKINYMFIYSKWRVALQAFMLFVNILN